MGLFFFNANYIWYVLIPTLIISAGAQLYIRQTFGKWSEIRNSRGITGAQTAVTIIQAARLGARFPRRNDCRTVEGSGLCLDRVPGSLTDNYDPRSRVVRLSQTVADRDSVAAMAVAAHELGHVQQHETGSILIQMRNVLVPTVQISPMISYFLLIAGFFFNMTGLIWLGILFFGLMVLFSVLTIPVELDASRRAIKLLQETGVAVTQDDIGGARAVLMAAAMTYIAAAITSVLQLLYLISQTQRRRR